MKDTKISRIMDLLSKNPGGLTMKWIWKELGHEYWSQAALSANLNRLIGKGLVERTGSRTKYVYSAKIGKLTDTKE